MFLLYYPHLSTSGEELMEWMVFQMLPMRTLDTVVEPIEEPVVTEIQNTQVDTTTTATVTSTTTANNNNNNNKENKNTIFTFTIHENIWNDDDLFSHLQR
jgi:hypothetical protein